MPARPVLLPPSRIASLAGCCVLAACLAAAAQPPAPVYDRAEEVAPGIRLRERSFFRAAEGPFAMAILEVDPAHPAVNLLPVRALDKPAARETVSSMARRYGASAAVNGGYFVVAGPQAGASTGVYQLNGQLISGGAGRTAAVFCREDERGVERIIFSVLTAFPPRPYSTPPAPGCDPLDIVGAGPRLLAAGQPAPGEGFAHENRRHPRTAIATTRGGRLLLAAVDGRQAHSAGMTLSELASELAALGAVDALNLDGGGSTTLYAGGRVRNKPSDPVERPVSDAILVFSIPTLDALESSLETLAADPAHLSASLRDQLRPLLARSRTSPAALDAFLQRLDADPSLRSWQASRILGEAARALRRPR